MGKIYISIVKAAAFIEATNIGKVARVCLGRAGSYVVVAGLLNTAVDASRAVSGLTDEVKANKPLPRKFSEMQNEGNAD